MRTACLSLLLAALLLPVAAPSAAAGPSARDRALLAALHKQRLVRVRFKDTGLKDIVKWLRIATSKNILVKQATLTKAGIEWQDLKWTVDLDDVSVWTFLSEIVAKPHGMAVVVKGNIVFLTSKADSYGKPITRLYGISYITWTKTDFIGPRLDLRPSGEVADEEYEPEKPVENDPLTSGDAVADLVKELVMPKGWEANDKWSIRATDRYLVIRAPAEVHRLIPAALSKIASMK
jgi:hypothetical protein